MLCACIHKGNGNCSPTPEMSTHHYNLFTLMLTRMLLYFSVSTHVQYSEEEEGQTFTVEEDWKLRMKEEDLSAKEDGIQDELVEGEREGLGREMFVSEHCQEEFDDKNKLLIHTNKDAFNYGTCTLPL